MATTKMRTTTATIITALAVVSSFAKPPALSDFYGFSEMEIIKLSPNISDLRAVDLNKDGRTDLVLLNNDKARIELLLQKQTAGVNEKRPTAATEDTDINDIFNAQPTHFKRIELAVSQKLYSLACGDLNSDGLPDLACYGRPAGLYIWLQKPHDSDSRTPIPKWRPRRKITIEDGLMSADSLVCCDLDNDGADDLALAARDGVYIITQQARGRLSEPLKQSDTADILAIQAGDVNGDGVNDLLAVTDEGSKPVHVRYGLPSGGLGPQMRFFIEKPYVLRLRDLDGQGADEILAVDAVNGRLNGYRLTTEKDDRPWADWPVRYYPLPAGDGTGRHLATGDFNGDGLTDVAISDRDAAEIMYYRQVAGSGLTEGARSGCLAGISNMVTANVFAGNEKDEIAVLSVQERFIGVTGLEQDRFVFPRGLEVSGQPLAMDLADIDGDGGIDCVYVTADTQNIRSMRILYNLGARPTGGLDKDRAETILPLEKLEANPDGIKILDADQDGMNDVLIFARYELPTFVRQVEPGGFELVTTSGTQASLIKDATTRSISLTDVNGNEASELLIAGRNFARAVVFRNGAWTVIEQYNAKSTENDISAAAAFHIDETSARPAVLLLDGLKGRMQVLTAGDGGAYRFETELDVGRWNPVSNLQMTFGRFSGAETKNILLFDGDKFAIVTPPDQNGGEARFETLFTYETRIKDGLYGGLAAGDINSDGLIDLVMVEYKHNHLEVLAIAPGPKPLPAMRFKVFEEKSYRREAGRGRAQVEPRELLIADVTNDGKNDLIAIIHDRVIVYPQD